MPRPRQSLSHGDPVQVEAAFGAGDLPVAAVADHPPFLLGEQEKVAALQPFLQPFVDQLHRHIDLMVVKKSALRPRWP